MARWTDFPGADLTLTPPVGWSEAQVGTMKVFSNGACVASCWTLEADELVDVVRSGRVWQTIVGRPPPSFIGSERTVRQVVADYGAVWKLTSDRSQASAALEELIALRDAAKMDIVVVPTELIDRILGTKRS